MDDKLKLKYGKYLQREETRFAKADKKYGSEYMREWVKKYPALENSYRNYIFSIRKLNRDEWWVLSYLSLGLILFAIDCVSGGPYFVSGLCLGIGIFNLVYLSIDQLHVQISLQHLLDELRFCDYEEAIDEIEKAVKAVKGTKDEKTNES